MTIDCPACGEIVRVPAATATYFSPVVTTPCPCAQVAAAPTAAALAGLVLSGRRLPPACVCGHAPQDHREAGVVMVNTGLPALGRCATEGCGCVLYLSEAQMRPEGTMTWGVVHHDVDHTIVCPATGERRTCERYASGRHVVRIEGPAGLALRGSV